MKGALLVMALSLCACSRSSATPETKGAMRGSFGDAGASAIWSGDVAPSTTNYALVGLGDCGDLILSDRGREIHRWDGGVCDPCLMRCVEFAGQVLAQEPIGATSHPYIAAMLGCAARCANDGGAP